MALPADQKIDAVLAGLCIPAVEGDGQPYHHSVPAQSSGAFTFEILRFE
jgi:hypothetical protein